jgi:hypothetical protein
MLDEFDSGALYIILIPQVLADVIAPASKSDMSLLVAFVLRPHEPGVLNIQSIQLELPGAFVVPNFI